MAKYCPIINSKVTYLVCQECDNKICENDTNSPIKEDEKRETDKSL